MVCFTLCAFMTGKVMKGNVYQFDILLSHLHVFGQCDKTHTDKAEYANSTQK